MLVIIKQVYGELDKFIGMKRTVVYGERIMSLYKEEAVLSKDLMKVER
ncbi:hypothetical protein [Wolbachia endosymbiont of Dirofilaria (Dirofilaria) immitis]|nr:hypothetical protein [Wolbachia endosymbiont of Dirofilaria (Dirofilaria) immitis]